MSEASVSAQYVKMTETPVHTLIPRLAVPTIISMLVSSFYNMADTFFVSRIGTSASGAVGIVFSLMSVIQAVGFTVGMGGGVVAASALGGQDREKADSTVSTAFFTAIGIGLVITLLGSFFLTPLVDALGATPTIRPYAESYARYILYAAPFMIGQLMLNITLRSEGKAFYTMVGITTGGVLNILLDPIFIFVLGLGTAGAAIATAISQIISFFILLSAFLSGKSESRIRFRAIRLSLLPAIVSTGLPSLARQGLASVAAIALNVNAARFGDAAVAAMSISGRVTFFIFSALLGFGQGFQPVSSYNWGAGNYRRVREATLFTAGVGSAIITAFSALCFISAPLIVRSFIKDDPMVVEVGTAALRFQCMLLPLCGINVTTNMALQGTRHVAPATFLAMCRQGIFFIPSIFTLSSILGLRGVEMAQPVADFFTFLCSLFFFIRFIRECSALEEKKA